MIQLRSKRGSIRTAVALIAALCLLAAACGSDGDSTDTSSGTDATTQDDTADDTAADDSAADDSAADDSAADDSAEATDDAGDSMGDPVTLNLGHPFPAAHPIQANALEQWAADVNAATDGTVTIEFFAGGALAPAPQVYENTVSGAQDIGWALQGYTPGRFPVTDVIEMPFTFDSATSATSTLWDLYEEFPEFQAEYDDVVLLGMWTHDTGDLWLNGDASASLDDLVGKTLRAPSPVQNAVISALGANPVGLPAPELYDSLERGVIDGLFIANSGLTSFNLFDVVDSGVDCDCYVAAQFLTANKASWDSLSDGQKAAIEAISGRTLSMRAAEVYDEAAIEAAVRVEEAGITIVSLSDDDLATWKAATAGVVDDWISSNAGDFPSQAMYDRAVELAG